MSKVDVLVEMYRNSEEAAEQISKSYKASPAIVTELTLIEVGFQRGIVRALSLLLGVTEDTVRHSLSEELL